MRRLLTATLTVLIWSGAAYGEQGTGTIQGVVRRADTKEPISGASVRLMGSSAVSDSAGRFRFLNVAAGTHVVLASKDDYFIVGAIQGSTPTRSTVARIDTIVGVSSTPSDVVLELLPGGRITGRVLDQNGVPAANVQVAPMTERFVDGYRAMGTEGRAIISDDRGEFRIFGLPPGKYYLRAQWRAVAQNPEIVTYYPSAAVAREAQSIDVQADREVVVEIKAATAFRPRISAKAVAVNPTVNLPPAVQVFGVPRGDELRDSTAEMLAPSGGTGRGRGSVGPSGFEVRGLSPGLYDFFVRGLNASDGTPPLAGRVSLDVRDKDIEGLTVPLSPTLEVQVRMVSNGNFDPPPIRTALSLRSIDPLPPTLQPRLLASPAGARSEWTFTSVLDGRYVVDFQDSGFFYVADIRQGTRSVYEDGVITIGPDESRQVEVTMARQGGTVQGVVQDATGKPIASAQVVLIPEGRRRSNPLFYRRVFSGTDGQITLTGVAPGSYKVFAWDNLPSGAERNAKFMEPFEQRGRVVTVSAPGVTVSNIVVPLIRR